MNIKFRRLKQKDASIISLIENEVALSPWSLISINDEINLNKFAVCLEFEKQIVAYIFSRFLFNEAEIMNLGTALNFQRKGFAIKMMNFLIEECKSNSIDRIFLEVSSQNKNAIKLYLKLNFIQNGKRLNYYKNGDDALLFVKYL